MVVGKCKPELALTAGILFTCAGMRARKRVARLAAFAVVLNATLCHLCGWVDWDVFCNAILATFVLLTCRSRRRRHTIVKLSIVASLVWLVNHHLVDSPFLHALLVQGLGAWALTLY
jgi:hypothetical protein